jgi:hypothetical protein
VLLGVTACGGVELVAVSSGPMTLTFEPDSASAQGTRLANGMLRCDMPVTIVAHGGLHNVLTLQTIAATFYDSTGAESNTVFAAPNDWFGLSQMLTDQSASAHRQPVGAGPSRVSANLLYLDQLGASHVATYIFVCTN